MLESQRIGLFVCVFQFFQKSQKLHMNDLITIQITLFLGDAVEFITSVHLFHMFPVSSQTTFFQVRKHME